MEPHFHLAPPDESTAFGRIELIEGRGRRELRPANPGDDFTWGYAGHGPNVTSHALLEAAVGHTASDDANVVIAFTSDVTSFLPQDQPAILSVREVRAWYDDRAEAVRKEVEERPRVVTARDMAEHMKRDFDELVPAGGRVPWLTMYRQIHGQPDV